MPQLVCYNPEINQRIREVKITRCLEECEIQWRSKQGKLEWEKQKKEEMKIKKRELGKEEERKRKRTIEVKKLAAEWEIQEKEEKEAKSEVEARKLVPERFYK